MGYWTYYLAWIALTYALHRPWLMVGALVFFVLRPFIPDPWVLARTFGRIRALEAQIAANPADPMRPTAERGEPVILVANSTLYRVFTNSLDDVRNGAEPVGGTAPFTVLQRQ